MDARSTVPRDRAPRIVALKQVARVTRRFRPRGTHRLLTRVYSPERRTADSFEVIRPYGDGMRIRLDTSSFIEWQIFFYGSYEPEIARLVRGLSKRGGTSIDVGANVGCHTLIMAACAGEGGRVIALEPHPRVLLRLRDNVAMNGLAQVETLRIAAGERTGTTQLYAPSVAHHGAGKATLYEGNLALDAGAAAAMERIDVPVTTVDLLMFARECEQLDVIKIDVEGHEMPVLRGARETIARFRPAVIFEYTAEYWSNAGATFADARAFFEAQRYELRFVTPKGPGPFDHARNGNYLATPN